MVVYYWNGWSYNNGIRNKSLATIIVNIVGSFLIGFVFYKLSVVEHRSIYWLMIATGFLGGLTTFSTFSLDMFNYLMSGDLIGFFKYVFISVLVGLLSVSSGYFFIEAMFW